MIIMKLYTVLKMSIIEYIVIFLINFVLKDIIKIILNQEFTQLFP